MRNLHANQRIRLFTQCFARNKIRIKSDTYKIRAISTKIIYILYSFISSIVSSDPMHINVRKSVPPQHIVKHYSPVRAHLVHGHSPKNKFWKLITLETPWRHQRGVLRPTLNYFPKLSVKLATHTLKTIWGNGSIRQMVRKIKLHRVTIICVKAAIQIELLSKRS